MFPAWVPHGVVENNTKAKGDKSLRVSVSFNFIQVPIDNTPKDFDDRINEEFQKR